MKKIMLFVLVSLFIVNLAHSETIHIWVEKNQKDYSWENDLVKELRNSKYSEKIGSYKFIHDYTELKDNDYILWITKDKIKNQQTYYGVIQLFKYDKNKDELYLRKFYYFSCDFDFKLDWIYESKNTILEWINEGATSY